MVWITLWIQEFRIVFLMNYGRRNCNGCKAPKMGLSATKRLRQSPASRRPVTVRKHCDAGFLEANCSVETAKTGPKTWGVELKHLRAGLNSSSASSRYCQSVRNTVHQRLVEFHFIPLQASRQRPQIRCLVLEKSAVGLVNESNRSAPQLRKSDT